MGCLWGEWSYLRSKENFAVRGRWFSWENNEFYVSYQFLFLSICQYFPPALPQWSWQFHPSLGFAIIHCTVPKTNKWKEITFSLKNLPTMSGSQQVLAGVQMFVLFSSFHPPCQPVQFHFNVLFWDAQMVEAHLFI